MRRAGSSQDRRGRRRARALRLRVERHELGPRIYFLGLRWHEWHLGLGILVALLVGIGLEVVREALPSVLAFAAAIWLIVKDWRDLFARTATRARGGSGCTAGRIPAPGQARRRRSARSRGGRDRDLRAREPALGADAERRWRGHLLLRSSRSRSYASSTRSRSRRR